jgi:hypothetical protein
MQRKSSGKNSCRSISVRACRRPLAAARLRRHCALLRAGTIEAKATRRFVIELLL